MKILHLYCSPRGRASESYRLSRSILDRLLERHPSARVVERALAAGAPSHVDGDYAAVLGGMRAADAAPARGSLDESDRLIRELEEADRLVIGTPMHNYTVPSALKAWIDHVVRVHRTFLATPEGKTGSLRDRPVFVAVSSGGRYSHGEARQPDFLTPYLIAVLNTIGLRDIAFFSVEGAALGPQALATARERAARRVAVHFATVAA